MSRPLIPLALIFALVIAAAGGLLYWSGQGTEPALPNAPADTQRAAADLGARTEPAIPAGPDAAGGTAQAPALPGQPTEVPSGNAEAGAPAAPGDTAAAPSISEPLAGEAAADPATAAAAASGRPTFDVVRVEPNGKALLAGRAQAGAAIEIVSGEEVIARATADAEGAFLAIPDAALPPGSHNLSVRVAGSPEPVGPEQRVAVIVPGGDPDGPLGGGEQTAGASDAAAAGEGSVGAPAPGQSGGAEQQTGVAAGIGTRPEPGAPTTADGAGSPAPASGATPAAPGDMAAANPGTAAPGDLSPGQAGDVGGGSVIPGPADPGAPAPDTAAGPPGAPGAGTDVAGVVPEGAEVPPGQAAEAPIAGAPADPVGAGTQAPVGVDVVIGPPGTPGGTPDRTASNIAPPDVASAPPEAPAAGEQEVAALEQPGSAGAADPTDPAAASIAPAGPATPDEVTAEPSLLDPGAAATTAGVAGLPEGLPDVRYAPLPPNFGKAAPGAGTDVAALPGATASDGNADAEAGTGASMVGGSAAAPRTDAPGSVQPVVPGGETSAGTGDGAPDAVDDPPAAPGALAAAGDTPGLPDVRYAPELPNFDAAGAAPGAAPSASPPASGAGEQNVAALPTPGAGAGGSAPARSDGAEDATAPGRGDAAPGANAAVGVEPPAPSGAAAVTPGVLTPAPEGGGGSADAVKAAGPDVAGAGQAPNEDTGEITLQGSAAALPDPAASGSEAGAAAGDGAGAVVAAGPLPLPATMDGLSGEPSLQGSATAEDPAPAATAAGAPVPDAAPASAAVGQLPLGLSIKAAEAEADKLYVAGAAPPGTLVRIYADEDLVGEVRASDKGAWLVEARKDVPLGEVVIRADVVDAASQSTAAKVEVPFTRFTDGVVLEPAVTASAEGTGARAEGDVPQPAFVIIRRGDNLWRISKRNYGRGIRYHSIFGANRDQIRNPNRIYPGQVFVVPTRDRRWEAATN